LFQTLFFNSSLFVKLIAFLISAKVSFQISVAVIGFLHEHNFLTSLCAIIILTAAGIKKG
jgi:hypothetical protein